MDLFNIFLIFIVAGIAILFICRRKKKEDSRQQTEKDEKVGCLMGIFEILGSLFSSLDL